MSDKLEHSAKLKDSLVGEERISFWENIKSFYDNENLEEESDNIESTEK